MTTATTLLLPHLDTRHTDATTPGAAHTVSGHRQYPYDDDSDGGAADNDDDNNDDDDGDGDDDDGDGGVCVVVISFIVDYHSSSQVWNRVMWCLARTRYD